MPLLSVRLPLLPVPLRELTPPAQGLLGLLLAREGLPDSEQPQTFLDAYNLLHSKGKGLFGAPDKD